MTLTLLKLLDFKNGIYMSVLLLKKKKKGQHSTLVLDYILHH